VIQYQVISYYICLQHGTLELTEKQAKLRSHCLKKTKKGFYKILEAVQFKHGEVFGHDGDIPKEFAKALIVVEEPVEPEKTEVKPRVDLITPKATQKAE